MKYKLADCEARSLAYKNFEVPTYADRTTLRVGDLAKLVFEFDPLPNGCNGERMWVRITTASPGAYTGQLVTHPTLSAHHGLRYGAPLDFGPEHVAAIERGRARPS